MHILALLCAVAVAFTGLTRGAGVLPDALNAAVGDAVMFTTTVTPPETPFQSLQWKFGANNIIYFNVNNITAPEYESRITLFMSTGSLELRNLTLNDNGEYDVNIVRGGGGVLPEEGKTKLGVYEKVSGVTATGSSTDLEEDMSVRLSCSSSSGSSFSFLWLNGSSEVTASDRVQLTDGGSTLTMNVTRYDQGPFRCRVSNLVSSATSDPIHLSISYGPENINLKIDPSQKYHEKGSNIMLSCSADSRPAAHYTWLLNGTLQSDTGSVLNLINVQESQSGNYSCRAFNSKTLIYETSPPLVVSILEKVSGVTATGSSTDLEEDMSVRLSCSSSSGSSLSFLWLNGSSEVTASDRVQLTDGGSTLTMNVTRYDQGPFRCRVSNPLSSATSDPIHLSISYGPENMNLKIDPSQEYYEKGSNIILSCSADSRPAAHYTWLLNGTLQSDTGSVLILINVQESQSGNYSCRAFNSKTLIYETSPPSVVSILDIPYVTDIPAQCSDGCIAGIVIGLLVVCGLCGGGGYMLYTKQPANKLSVNITNTSTGTGAEGQDNNAYAGTQELRYADISIFQKTNSGTVQLVSQSNSEYAEIRGNNNPPEASSPPTYDAHQQRMKKPAPQPPPDAAELYAQVRKK